jgi:lipopolysaccharide cholinephosphotransferase
MATYDIRPLQLHILRNLQAVDRMCRQHGLRYYIMAGTLLGAVRHKGFIPWDDDLDIGMPREDYDLFIQHAHEWLPQPYELVCAETDPTYPLPFGKVQDASTTLIERRHLRYLGGVYIDVFPLDGVPEGRLSRRWHFAKYEFYKRVLYLVHRDPYKHGHGARSWVPLLCRKLFTVQGVQHRICQLLHRYQFAQSSSICDYDDGLRGIMPKAELGQPTPILFEGVEVWGVQERDTYLARKYGDYMTIPKQSGQRQHNFHYMSLEEPYREYKGE